MAFKLKLDANGAAVIQDGKPVYVNEEGKEEEFSIELDSQVFYLLCQEAMRSGVRVEEFILDSLMESMEEFDGERS